MALVEPALKRSRQTLKRVFVDIENVDEFGDENVVKVDEVWEIILNYISTNHIALIKAPPKAGKTMLGKLAAAGRVDNLKEQYEVRYCEKLAQVGNYLERWGARTIEELAKTCGKSWTDSCSKKIIYFFDETDELPQDVNTYFINNKYGYAVFASAGTARQPDCSETPKGLLQHTFYYKFPSHRNTVAQWISGRIQTLFQSGGEVDERCIGLMTELMMNLSGGHVGILQYIGSKCEKAETKTFQQMRDGIVSMLRLKREIALARCFGVANGSPDPQQGELIAMMRCSGSTALVDVTGTSQSVFKFSNPSHRHGLSMAYYALETNSTNDHPLENIVEESCVGSFVHALQPELYDWKISTNRDWSEACQVTLGP